MEGKRPKKWFKIEDDILIQQCLNNTELNTIKCLLKNRSYGAILQRIYILIHQNKIRPDMHRYYIREYKKLCGIQPQYRKTISEDFKEKNKNTFKDIFKQEEEQLIKKYEKDRQELAEKIADEYSKIFRETFLETILEKNKVMDLTN